MPGQFGVPHFVATGASCAGGLIDQEVRVAQELAVEERGLENDVGPGTQGQLGFSVPGLQVPAQVRSAFQRVDAGAEAGIPLAVFGHQAGQLLSLSLVF